ncbi:MAG: DUF1444 family protein [Planctomycetota bacterium]
MPHEPEAFGEQVLNLLRRLHPDMNAALTGPRELVVDGRRLDLENLSRLVNADPDRGVEIVEHYLEQLLDSDAFAAAAMPWDMARHRIMPRIQPESIFDHLSREHVAHVPYVNSTVVVFVIDLPNMTVSVTTEQLIRWERDADDLESLARANLDRYTNELEFRRVESSDGGVAFVISSQDGYDASRLLLGRLHETFAPELGGDFLAAAPSRDMLLAVSPDPAPFVERLKDRVEQDYARLPYPITHEMFLVTRDGVAGTRAA